MRAAEIVKRVQGRRVLDVGCTGTRPYDPDWVHGALRERTDQLVGIDTNERAVAAMRARGFNVEVQDAQRFSLPGKFETIVAGEVIEHIQNPGLFLERARDHLAVGGRIVLTTPYAFALVHILYAASKFPKTCSNPEHVVWFCPRTMSALVERAGLRVVEWDLIEDYPPDIGRKIRVLVLLMRLLRLSKRLRANAMLYVLERRAA